MNVDMEECACYLLEPRKKKFTILKFGVNYETLEPANDIQRDQIVKLSVVAGMVKVEGIRMSIVDDDDKILVPPQLVKVEYRPRSDGEDDWSDISGSELGPSEGAGDEDDKHDSDDDMKEDTNEEARRRYDLRPR